VGITKIESNRNRHFGLKIESKSIENRNLEIVTSLVSNYLTQAKAIKSDMKRDMIMCCLCMLFTYFAFIAHNTCHRFTINAHTIST